MTSIHSEPALRQLPPTHLAQDIWRPCVARYKALVAEPSWKDRVPITIVERDNEPSPPPSRELSSTPPMCNTMCSLSTSDSPSTRSSTTNDTTANDGTVPSDVLARMQLVETRIDRCLITNTLDTVEFAYCVPREPKASLLDSLEFAWNMESGTLNTDSRYNIFPVSAELRSRFETGDWVLLPTVQQVETYWASGSIPIGRHFPDIPNGVFEYTLLAQRRMKGFPIRQYPRLGSADDATTPDEQHRAHEYPYEELGVMRLHLHPRFVIWNLGRKVKSHFWELINGAEDRHPLDSDTSLAIGYTVAHSGRIYSKWMEHGQLPRRRPSDDVRIAPSISSSQQTKRRRATPLPKPNPEAGLALPPGAIPLTARNLKALQSRYSKQSVPTNLRIMRWRVACECGSIYVEDVDEDALETDASEASGSECDIEMDGHVNG
ncbi:hypothetical protein PLICRDRAFT_289557 [Plicaturopsis crispa FD-325 SS-3]|nr:hypothetical protein PLICRDRAFT_289557 [Plicaturopsis crispa FD-325 SS-3]